MSVPSFDEMLGFCEHHAREWLTDTKKSLPQTWVLFYDDDRPTEIIVSVWESSSPFTKKLAMADMRQRIADPHVVAFAVVTEAWMSRRPIGGVTPDGVPVDGVMPSEDPQRREVVICYAATLTEREQRTWEMVRDYKGTIRMLRPAPEFDILTTMDDPHMAGAIPNMFREAGRL